MRGPGEASGIYAIECAMDELAHALGIDPIELRRRNEPEIDEGEGKPFSSRSLMDCYDLGAGRFGWSRRDPAPRSMRDGRLMIGMGDHQPRSEEHTSELQSLMRISYAVFCLKKKKNNTKDTHKQHQ